MPSGIAIVDPELCDERELAAVDQVLRTRNLRQIIVIDNPFQVDKFRRLGYELVEPARSAERPADLFSRETRIHRALQRSRDGGATEVDVRGLREVYSVDVVSLAYGSMHMLYNHIAVHAALARWDWKKGAVQAVVSRRRDFVTAVNSALEGQQSGRVDWVHPQASRARAVTGGMGSWRALARDLARLPGRPLTGRRLIVAGNHRQILPLIPALEASGEVDVLLTLPVAVARALRALGRWRSDRLAHEGESCVRTLALQLRFDDPGDAVAARSFLSAYSTVVGGDLVSSRGVLWGLDLLSPDLVLAIYWAGFPAHVQRAWCLRRRRPFAVIQHGFQLGSTLSPETESVEADVYYCWGEEFSRRWVPPETRRRVAVEPLGNPLYSGLRPGLRSGPLRDKPVILVAPTRYRDYHYREYLEFWRFMFDWISSGGGAKYQWVFRLHPTCSLQDLVAERARELGAEVSDSKTTFMEAARAADVVITSISSAGVDAAALGRVVIVVNDTGEPEYFTESGVGAVAADLRELPALLERLVTDPQCRKLQLRAQDEFIERMAVDDSAALIASDLIRRANGGCGSSSPRTGDYRRVNASLPGEP
jgi:hypothetical protein